MPVFDRIPSPPSQSAAYPIRALFRQAPVVREVHWRLTPDFPLNQGEEGACVGHGVSAELSADPIMLPTGQPFAFELYRRAREQDARMGFVIEGEGATVLGGLRAARALGLIRGFRWAQSSEDIRDAVLAHGSVVMGTVWREGMYDTDEAGLLHVTGDPVGGHCWTLIGYVPAHPQFGECFVGINSWGRRWGKDGRFFIRAADVRALFEDDGEAAIVTDQPQTPTEQPGGGAYFAAPRSKVFHDNHRGVRRGLEFSNRDAAVSAGFTPCRNCRP